jgi:hypothetical protein
MTAERYMSGKRGRKRVNILTKKEKGMLDIRRV